MFIWDMTTSEIHDSRQDSVLKRKKKKTVNNIVRSN